MDEQAASLRKAEQQKYQKKMAKLGAEKEIETM